MRTVKLTVLVHDGPMARAYLESMRLAGLRPERVVLMVYSRDPSTGNTVAGWLPKRWRAPLARRVMDIRFNYWSRYLAKNQEELFNAIVRDLGAQLDFPRHVFEGLLGQRRWSEYADSYEEVLVDDANDPALSRRLARHAPTAVLYTGGALLDGNTLSQPGIRFVHLHPGIVPHVRGADGLLWSTLVRGRAGVSCFYMSAALDAGDVIATHEFAPINVRLPSPELDHAEMYRAVYAFVDPVLRGWMLLQILDRDADMMAMQSQVQPDSGGVTYHFMHPALRRTALARLFTT